MGGIELDFRDARLAAGETHVTAVAVMGGIEIIVPPGLPVTVRGLGILGAVDQVEGDAEEISPNAPHVKVTALACMGGVEIKTRASKRVEQIASKRNEKRR
jgi:predicted membrane protein